MICSDTRIALPEAQQSEQQPWRCNEIKCPAPAKVSADRSADYVAERATDRNRRAKDRHDATTCFDREKIGQNRRRCRSVAALANSNAYASCKENRECRRQAGAAARNAPQNHSGTNDDPARESVGEQSQDWRADHVSDEKCVAEQTSLRHRIHVVRCKKSSANIRLERRQNLPVDVIEKIDGQEQKERGTRAAHHFFSNRLHCNCRLQFGRRRL